MSNTSYVFTDKLKLAQTKKIVNECMSLSSWKDVLGGEGGGIVNEDSLELEVNCTDLSNIELPNIASFHVRGEDPFIPNEPCRLLGGSSYSLPMGSGTSCIGLNIKSDGKLFLLYTQEISNYKAIPSILAENGVARNKKCKENGDIFIKIEFSKAVKEIFSTGKIERELISDEFERLTSLVEFLGFRCCSLDELIKFNESVPMPVSVPLPVSYEGLFSASITCHNDQLTCMISYDTNKQPKWNDLHLRAQEWMRGKNLDYNIFSDVDLGGMNWFHGFTSCVTQQAYDLVRHEAANPQYESYFCSYMTLEPETWPSREKRRKKITKPIYQQLGECSLENGVKLTLRLKIVKEGYVVYLDFPNDDDMLLFEQSTLYRMTKWHCGAE